jgi:hypothetical protein
MQQPLIFIGGLEGIRKEKSIPAGRRAGLGLFAANRRNLTFIGRICHLEDSAAKCGMIFERSERMHDGSHVLKCAEITESEGFQQFTRFVRIFPDLTGAVGVASNCDYITAQFVIQFQYWNGGSRVT